MRIRIRKGSIDDFKKIIEYINENYKLEPDDMNLYISFKTKYAKFEFYNKDSTEMAYIDYDKNDVLDFDNLIPLTKRDHIRITDIMNSHLIKEASRIKKRIIRYWFYRGYGQLNNITPEEFHEIESDEIFLNQLIDKINETYEL